VTVYAVCNCSPGFPASEIVFPEDNSFLRKELLVLELFYKERINMELSLRPFYHLSHHDFRFMTMILRKELLVLELFYKEQVNMVFYKPYDNDLVVCALHSFQFLQRIN
jgi:5-keto 4-deoxyuronate isomerase